MNRPVSKRPVNVRIEEEVDDLPPGVMVPAHGLPHITCHFSRFTFHVPRTTSPAASAASRFFSCRSQYQATQTQVS